LPSAIALTRAQPVKRTIALAAAEHPAHDLRVEGAATSRHAPDRVDEALHIPHALLEQVADSLGVVPDQVCRVLLFVVLGQHQHADVRPLRSQRDNRPEAVVGVTWWHVDIGDHDRGAVRKALAEEILGIAGLSHDLAPGIGQQPGDALPEQDVVLTDHHSERP
jgi:hypothetical protein